MSQADMWVSQAEVIRTMSRRPHKERERARVLQSSWVSEALCPQVGKGKQEIV